MQSLNQALNMIYKEIKAISSEATIYDLLLSVNPSKNQEINKLDLVSVLVNNPYKISQDLAMELANSFEAATKEYVDLNKLNNRINELHDHEQEPENKSNNEVPNPFQNNQNLTPEEIKNYIVSDVKKYIESSGKRFQDLFVVKLIDDNPIIEISDLENVLKPICSSLREDQLNLYCNIAGGGGESVNLESLMNIIVPNEKYTGPKAFTLEEFMLALIKESFRQGVDPFTIFKQADPLQNLFLDISEFKSAVKKIVPNISDSNIEKNFNQIDTNQNSKIEYEEFCRSLEKFSKAKAVGSSDWTFSYFERIRKYIRDSKTHPYKIFQIDARRHVIEDGIFINSIELRNAFIFMNIKIDPVLHSLEALLDTKKNKKIDFLKLCEMIGYIPLIDSSPSKQKPKPGVKDKKFLTIKSLKEQFYLEVSNIYKTQRVKLKDDIEQDAIYSQGICSKQHFIKTIEKYTRNYSREQIEKMTEDFMQGNSDFKYLNFFSKLEEFCRQYELTNLIFKELKEISDFKNLSNIYQLFEGKDKEKNKLFKSIDIADVLRENKIEISNSKLEPFLNQFAGKGPGTFDFYSFEDQFNEYVKSKESNEGVNRGISKEMLISVYLEKLKEFYAISKASRLVDLFKNYNVKQGALTQMEFLKTVEEMVPSFSENDVHNMVSALDSGGKGEINLNILINKYNDYFHTNESSYSSTEKTIRENLIFSSIAEFSILKKVRPETFFDEYDPNHQGIISKHEFTEFLKTKVQILSQIDEASLEEFVNDCDASKNGLINCNDFTKKVLSEIDRKSELMGYLSQIYNSLLIHRTGFLDMCKSMDTFNEKTLPFDKVAGFIRSLNSGLDDLKIEEVLKFYTADLYKRIDYIKMSDDIQKCQLISLELAKSKDSKLVNKDNVLHDLALSVVANEFNLEKIFKAFDHEKRNIISESEFLKILLMITATYSQAQLMNFTKFYEDINNGGINYINFLADIEKLTGANMKNQKKPRNKVFINRIVDEFAKSLYLNKQDLLTFFAKFGLMHRTKTVKIGQFVEGVKVLQLEIDYHEDLKQLVEYFVDNDTETINLSELASLIALRQNEALSNLEISIFRKIIDAINSQNLEVKNIFKDQIDIYNPNLITIESFKMILLKEFVNLKEIDINFLIIKYFNPQNEIKINYPKFFEDIGKYNMQFESINKDFEELATKIKNISSQEKLKKDAFGEYDPNKSGRIKTIDLLDAFRSAEIDITEKELQILKNKFDTSNSNAINYLSMLNEIFSASVPIKLRQEKILEAEKLTEKIFNYCQKKGNIDLELVLMKRDLKKEFFLPKEDIRKAFLEVGIPLNSQQIDILLIYQPITTDRLLRKNYLELLNSIFGSNSVNSRFDSINFNELRLNPEEGKIVGSEINQSQDIIGSKKIDMLNNAAEQITKDNNLLSSTFLKANDNLIRTNRKTQFRKYFSTMLESAFVRVSKYVYGSNINLLRNFQEIDKIKQGELSKEDFEYVLEKLGIILNETDKMEVYKEILLKNDLISYRKFVDKIVENKPPDLELEIYEGKEEIKAAFNKNFQDNSYEKNTGANKFLLATQLDSNYAELSKKLANEPDIELMRIELNEEKIELAKGYLQEISKYIKDDGKTPQEVFSRYDTYNTGYILNKDFKECIIKDINVDLKDDILSLLFSFLCDKTGRISLANVYNSLADNPKNQNELEKTIQQENILASSSQFQVKKQEFSDMLASKIKLPSDSIVQVIYNPKQTLKSLSEYLYQNKIPFSLFEKNPPVRTISYEEFIKTVEQSGFIISNEESMTLIKYLDSLSKNEINIKQLKLEINKIIPKFFNENSITSTFQAKSILEECPKEIRENLVKINNFLAEKNITNLNEILESKIEIVCREEQFYEVINPIFRGLNINKEEICNIFNAIDYSKQKLITSSDLLFFLEAAKIEKDLKKEISVEEKIKQEAENIFPIYDTDKKKMINSQQLLNAIRIIDPNANLEFSNNIIINFDHNGDGMIDIEEFKELMFQLQKRSLLSKSDDLFDDLRKILNSKDISGIGTYEISYLYYVLKNEGYNIGYDDLKSICNEIEMNNEGSISIDDFIQFLKEFNMKNYGSSQLEKGVLAIKENRGYSIHEKTSIYKFDKDDFGPSFSCDLYKKGSCYPSDAFQVRLDKSGIYFEDFFPKISSKGNNLNKIMQIISQCSGYIVIKEAEGIPFLHKIGVKLENIINRRIIVTVYNKETQKFIYNSCFIDCVDYDIDSPDSWDFNKRSGIGTNPIIFKLNKISDKILIVLEFVVTILRGSDAAEIGCGYCTIDTIQLRQTQTIDIPLKNGSPFQERSFSQWNFKEERKGAGNFFKGIFHDIKPNCRIEIIKFEDLDEIKRGCIQLLPRNCVINRKLLHLLVGGRCYIGEKLLKGKNLNENVNSDLYYSVLIKILDCPDLLRNVLENWETNYYRNSNVITSSEKQDPYLLARHFESAMKSIISAINSKEFELNIGESHRTSGTYFEKKLAEKRKVIISNAFNRNTTQYLKSLRPFSLKEQYLK